MRTFTSAADLLAATGQELGTSDWLTVDQDRVNLFADATGDHQWIHVDVDRAASGPFGGTIAHGYLTLALLPQFAWSIYTVENVSRSINYGLNRVRFIHPVRVGSQVRSTVTLKEATEIPDGLQLTVTHKLEVAVDTKPKPACIAETISRVLF